MRRLRGAPVPAWLAEHARRIEAEYLRLMSAGGHENHCGEPQLERIGTTTAATLAGITTRHLRRIAPVLGGLKVGATWTFDRVAVERYAQERQRNE